MKVKKLAVSDVQFGPAAQNGRVALSCVHGEARYHVWLDPRTEDTGDALYKNPLDGIERHDKGYYETRILSTWKHFGAALVAAMMGVYHEKNLRAEYEKKQIDNEAARIARNEAMVRAERIRAAAPELYEACRAAFKAVAGWDSFNNVAEILDQAIRKAEGRAKED